MGAKVVKSNKNVVSKASPSLSTNKLKTTTSKSKLGMASPLKSLATPSTKLNGAILNTSPLSKHSITSFEKNETSSAFNPRRIVDKKQKIIGAQQKAMETSELDVLAIKKRNNHDFEDKDLINSCLMKHFFMRSLDKDARTEIIKEMTLCEVEEDTVVFKQGSMGNFFYIVKEGDLDLYLNEVFTKTIVTGESFGELALLHGAPRSGTVKTKTKTLLWCLERRNFRKIMDHINLINYEENIKFISSIAILANIDNDLKSVLASNLLKEYFDTDKYIVRGNINFKCRG
jgi:CRP-like cAMP-binding protein